MKLVVDNEPVSPDGEFTYEEFKTIAEQLLDLHARYPEIDALSKRARENKDMAMFMAVTMLTSDYALYRDFWAEHERRKLRVVKRRKPRK